MGASLVCYWASVFGVVAHDAFFTELRIRKEEIEMAFATYDDALAYIHGLPRLRPNNGRTELHMLLAAVGHPERQGHFIHVTGTNGKGSTTNAIAHILQAGGLHVGMFTSPFINRFNERIQIDGEPISDDEITTLAGEVATAITTLQEQNADFIIKEFEFVTTMGFLAFARAGLDVSVIEVGIGGMHDSTNVITPEVAVIVNVALDHMELLGDTIAAIAREKAGIIKPGVPVVTGPLTADAEEVVEEVAAQQESNVLVYGLDFEAHGRPNAKIFGETLDYLDADGPISKLNFPLIGDYQVVNAAIAIRAARLYAARMDVSLSDRQIGTGLAQASWPARLERISEEPTIVLDGGHNPDGLGHALAAIRALKYPQVTIIAGILADKALPEMLKQLRQMDADVILTAVPGTPRAATAADYEAAGSGDWRVMDWHDALVDAIYSNTEGVILVIGSLYLASAVRQELLD